MSEECHHEPIVARGKSRAQWFEPHFTIRLLQQELVPQPPFPGLGRSDRFYACLAEHGLHVASPQCTGLTPEQGGCCFVSLADGARPVKNDDGLAGIIEKAVILQLRQAEQPLLVFSKMPGDDLAVDSSRDYGGQNNHGSQLEGFTDPLGAVMPDCHIWNRQDSTPQGGGNGALAAEVQAGVEDGEEVQRSRHEIHRLEAFDRLRPQDFDEEVSGRDAENHGLYDPEALVAEPHSKGRDKLGGKGRQW